MSSKLKVLFVASVAVVQGEVFPDVLVPVSDQPKSPEDLVGLTMQGWAQQHVVTVMGDGKCLDVGGGESVDGAPVQLWTCLGNENQEWWAADVPWSDPLSFGDDRSHLKCLDVPGANLVAGQELWLWDCDSGASSTQKWVNRWGAGDVHLWLMVNDQQWCLERPSLDDGSRPTLQPCNDSPQQQWDVVRKLGTASPATTILV